MTHWKIGLPMYSGCAPSDHRLLVSRIVEGLRSGGWNEPVEVVEAPNDLHAFWRRADLLLGQACGYPLVTQLAGQVRLLGTAHYDFPGCSGFWYSSHILVAERAGARSLADLRGARAVFNQRDSQSGMNALRHAIAPLALHGRFFSSVAESGSHRASLQMVADGHADVAAVDCVTYGYLALHAPNALASLRILCRTAPTAGLPLITSSSVDDATAALLRQVLAQVFTTDPADAPAARLRIGGFTATRLADYESILAAQTLAHDFAYPELA
ncbi:phosphate/phosphite/phosphonate ABC transporter substrate-binding protein [Noviherbaspirillum suwonense]|uniref:ABC-type phosphate/phosphonate transport system, substrate-binding protein n=1 Tax=Noviherbaspirillum suwonense TaxID=1224511 RepID=A0ABY1Q6D7_9BURK|nr:PhnD/SsuA/transferrin family substrate-binding protein [Noviherbaspirillum suwonense]SMP61204.1 ABC-type phosphate/phosphonate transport system, substrate-binding protein [Noviherbaspirillum suwonense]